MWEGPNMTRDESLLWNGEVCKLIEGYGNFKLNYVSNTGRVWNVNSELSQTLIQGYLHTSIQRGPDDRPTVRVHILVASAFIENPFKGTAGVDYVVDHKDGNKENNHLSNLRFVTLSQNTRNVDKSKKRSTTTKTVRRFVIQYWSIGPILAFVDEHPVAGMAQVLNCTGDTVKRACTQNHLIDGYTVMYKTYSIDNRLEMVMLNHYCTLKELDINTVPPPFFVQIQGFSNYRVSQYGDIWSILNQTWITAYCDPNDMKSYWKIHMKPDKGKKRTVRVHRCVCAAFMANDDPDKKTKVNHIDTNSRNPYYENLEWCTSSRNSKHAVDEGCNERVVRLCQFKEDGTFMVRHSSIEDGRRSVDKEKGKDRCIHWYPNDVFNDSGYIWARADVCVLDEATGVYRLPDNFSGRDIPRKKKEVVKSRLPFFYGGPKIPNPVFEITR